MVIRVAIFLIFMIFCVLSSGPAFSQQTLDLPGGMSVKVPAGFKMNAHEGGKYIFLAEQGVAVNITYAMIDPREVKTEKNLDDIVSDFEQGVKNSGMNILLTKQSKKFTPDGATVKFSGQMYREGSVKLYFDQAIFIKGKHMYALSTLTTKELQDKYKKAFDLFMNSLHKRK